MKNLCFGKGVPVRPGDNVVIDNPASGLSRLNHWDTIRGDRRQTGVKRIRMKCTVCGRRMMSSVYVCHDGCCVHFSLPPHKPKGWWKKSTKQKGAKHE